MNVQVFTHTTEVGSRPVDAATLRWNDPISNGGIAISSYLVEWWSAAQQPEVQRIAIESEQGRADLLMSVTEAAFKVRYLGGSTAAIPQHATAADMRSFLMRIEDPFATGPSYLIQHVEVTRGVTPTGYFWDITFIGDQGDVPKLVVDRTEVRSLSNCGMSGANQTECITLAVDPRHNVNGQRRAGSSAIQTIELTDNSPSDSSPTGFFRLRVDGSLPSVYLKPGCSPLEVQKALARMPTVRAPVHVSLESIFTDSAVESGLTDGYRYTVTYSSLSGRFVPNLRVDGNLL